MISELRAGEKVHCAFLVRPQKIGISSNGKAFARGLLEDASGQIGFICFDGVSVDKIRAIEQPQPYIVSGAVDINKFATGEIKLQVVVQRISAVMPDDDLSQLMPQGDFDVGFYKDQLKRYVDMITSPTLRVLVDKIFTGPLYDLFVKNPAGKNYHHAYIGGLLQHSVDVTRLAVAMAEAIGNVDKNLVLAGALLHDLGKLQEISPNYGFNYTDRGRLLGHIAISALLVQSQAEQLKMPACECEQLLHILLSHHGEHENGSPVACETKEAFIVHYADELDSVMNQFKPGQNATWEFSKMLQRFLLVKN